MAKFQYSIKTVDGDRFVCVLDYQVMIEHLYSNGSPKFVWFPIKDGDKFINTANIVSITAREIDEDDS